MKKHLSVPCVCEKETRRNMTYSDVIKVSCVEIQQKRGAPRIVHLSPNQICSQNEWQNIEDTNRFTVPLACPLESLYRRFRQHHDPVTQQILHMAGDGRGVHVVAAILDIEGRGSIFNLVRAKATPQPREL